MSTFYSDMSGNEEIQPLTYAFDLDTGSVFDVMGARKPLTKRIFFLTDGGVGNHAAVVDLAKRNAHKA